MAEDKSKEIAASTLALFNPSTFLGGFAALSGFKKSAKHHARHAARRAFLSGRSNLMNILGGEEHGIDERTKEEILGRIGGLKGFDNAGLQQIGNYFAQAQEGTMAKFKTRMGIQQAYNSMVARPDASRLRGQILDFGSKVRK